MPLICGTKQDIIGGAEIREGSAAVFVQVSGVKRIHVGGQPAQVVSVGIIGKEILIIEAIERESDAPLTEAIGALNLHGFVFCATQRGQEHRRKNCDDGNDDEQFNERESRTLIFCRAHGARKQGNCVLVAMQPIKYTKAV